MSAVIPHVLPSGHAMWLAPEVIDFAERLKELNDRLALFKDTDGSWLIAYVPEFGEPEYVMRSTPGAPLGPHVIDQLKLAWRRFHDPVERMIQHNEKLEAQRRYELEEATLSAIDKMLSKSFRGRVTSTLDDDLTIT